MICNGCGLDKPFTEEYFPKNKQAKEGIEKTCKDCRKATKLKRSFPIIYIIKCIPKNKYYIGQTIKPLNDRISKHFSDAKRGRKQTLYDDIRFYNYDKSKFEWVQLELLNNKNELDKQEKYWIKDYIEKNYELYNREYGGKRGCEPCYETRVLMSQAKGISPFYVYDIITKEKVGEFNYISEANNFCNTTALGQVLDGTYAHSKNYIAIYVKDFSEEKLHNMINILDYDENNNVRYIKNNKGKIQKKIDNGGKNNPMYGKTYGSNPNSKKVYIIKNKTLEMYTSTKEAQELYNFAVSTYAIGSCDNYYKKLNMYVYYDSNLPQDIKDQIPNQLYISNTNYRLEIKHYKVSGVI